MAAPRTTFPTGWDRMMRTWTTDVYKGMILTPLWTPNPSFEVFVADISTFEITGTGYARQTLGTKTRAPILPATAAGIGYVKFDCADPNFGTPTDGAVGAWFAFYAEVTNDADSPIVAAFQINVTFDGSAVAIGVSGDGLMRDSSACPNDFS